MTTTLIKPTRPAAYLRQSKDDPDGIERQREDTARLCKDKGWPAPVVYEDDGKSASNGKARPEYARMLADIRAGKIDAVVVAQLDRLHRRPIELEEFINLADEKQIALACASGDVDLATDDGRFMARVMGAVARKEMERKSWRFKRAAEQRAEMGDNWWSVRPFGFERQPILDDEGKPKVNKHGTELWTPVHQPTEAALLREAYADVLDERASLYRICERWNSLGVTTPRGNKWRPSQLRQVLLSPRNCGLRTFRGELQTDLKTKQPVEGNWEPVVSEETWRAVRDVLARPERRTGVSRARKHLLSNLAVCGVQGCGSRLGSGVNKGGKLIYSCRSCNRNSRNGQWLDALVTELVVQRLSREDAIELTRPEARDDLEEVRERGRVLRARLDSLAVEFADGVLSPAQIKTMTTRINEQLAEVEAVLRDAQTTRVYRRRARGRRRGRRLRCARPRPEAGGHRRAGVRGGDADRALRSGHQPGLRSLALQGVIASTLPISKGQNRNHDAELYRSSTIK